MSNIKPIGVSSEKWQRRAAGATQDYSAGVSSPRTPWAAASAAGENNYKQGVTAAAARGAYGKGVKAAGDASWQKGAQIKGPSRYAEGVSLATDDWQKGYSPYHSAVAALTLPARGPKGSPQNLQRVNMVATTLRGVYEKKQS